MKYIKITKPCIVAVTQKKYEKIIPAFIADRMPNNHVNPKRKNRSMDRRI